MRRLLYLIPALALLAQPLLAQRKEGAPVSSRITEGIESDLTADQQVMQVLNRLAFGPRPGDVETVRHMGITAWIDQQLHPKRINDSALDQLIATYPRINQSQSDLAQDYVQFVQARKRARQDRADTTSQSAITDRADLKRIVREHTQLMAELTSARVARAEVSNRQLLEVMTDFWENHFNVYARKGTQEAYYLVDFDNTIREHALGKFRDLLGAVAHSPAMLFYLDNAQSRANPGQPTVEVRRANNAVFRRVRQQRNVGQHILDSMQTAIMRQRAQKNKTQGGLNENYGRELLELHTLGVDGGYTQQDVINVARALTGWSIRPPAQGGGFIFRPQWHDAASKVILGHTLPAGRGEEDGEEVLDIIAHHPATAHFIALQLARRFVSDSPSTALVDRAAQTFLHTDGDIREVVRTIITSPEFFSRAAYRSKVKSPFEVVISTARALGAHVDTTARTALAVTYLGQPIFGHQDPNGWPETGESWMNTGAILSRINFGMAVAANRLPGASITALPWAVAVRNAPREQQVDAVVANILGGAVSPDMRKILLSGEHPFAAQAAAQATAQATPSADSTDDDTMMMTQPKRTKKEANTASLDVASARKPGKRPNQGIAFGRNGFGPPPNLTGLPQIIGLALGSPEFQRR